jgi:DNA-binding response OmpR family regulator
MVTILVVDDDPVVRDVVVRYLQRDGYRTLEADDGAAARVLIEETRPDLVVLDVMLPEVNGLELCRWIRSTTEIAVILLTARGEEADRIVGLELGADDYVVKPFSPRELVARVRTVLRRSIPPTGPVTTTPSERITGGDLEIDAETREVTRAGKPVELTAREFDLLYCLARHPKVVFSRSQLLAQVWGYDNGIGVGEGTVTVHIRRLREKIEEDPSHPSVLQTVWGVGYRFTP